MSAPDFSVVMTTRNRPGMFEDALKSVLSQQGVSLEVVIVNDGSSAEFLPAYKELEKRYNDRTNFVYLIASMGGHGQSYAINQGGLHAKGTYLVFMDDDDFFIDDQHLARAKAAFSAEDSAYEIYCTLQEAWLKGVKIQKPSWLDKNLTALKQHPAKAAGVFYAHRGDMLANGAFAHVNNVIIKRNLFMQIKGFDENIRYECDREFFLRAVDSTGPALFSDCYVSKHHVPDAAKTDNLSTAIQSLVKQHFQVYLYTKLILSAKTPEVRKVAYEGQGYTLKHMTEHLIKEKNFRAAQHFGGMALMAQLSLKWLGYYLYLTVRRWFS